MTDNLSLLLPLLACPVHGTELQREGVQLACERGHRFPVVDGVPVLLRDDVANTLGVASESLRLAHLNGVDANGDPYFTESLGLSDSEKQQVRSDIAQNRGPLDPVVSYLVGATNGILYKHLIGSLGEYPIPVLPMTPGNGEYLLDVGCSWGRWSIAAAKLGYYPIGIDPSLGAVLAAKRLSARLGLPFAGVVGDARFLPFKPGVFGAAHSYSVLQHFSKPDAGLALTEIKRTLRAGGLFRIQMASAWGIRSIQHQASRNFREPSSFEVRYWSPVQLRRTFCQIFGDVHLSVDCYFGLGLQASDLRLMSKAKRALIQGSELLKKLSVPIAPLKYIADSIVFEGTASV